MLLILSFRASCFHIPQLESPDTSSRATMTKAVYLLAVVCLICITITSSLPGCLSVRPFPADQDAVVGVTVDPTVDELNPTDSDTTVTSTFSNEVDEFLAAEEDDTTVHPCYAALDGVEIEGRTDDSTTDSYMPLVEVDCRRMLGGDYTDPRSNTNPKCANSSKC